MSDIKNIPNGWVETTLGEVGKLARGKSKHRPRWAPHLFGGDYPFIQTGQIKSARKYIKTFEQTYSEAGLAQSKLWDKDTLCITIAANIAEIAILEFPACFPDSVLGFKANEKKCDLDFIYYNFTMVQAELRQLAIGSVQDNINLGTFENLHFLIPPLPEQKSIAAILTAFDDKIELLQTQNKTLEETAQTIFAAWFGKYQIGDELPEGWSVGKLSDLLEIKYGKDHKHLKGGDYPLYGSGGIMRYVEKPLYEKESILIPRKGTLSNLFYLNQPFWSVDTMFYSKIKNPFQGRYIFLFLKSLDLSAMNVGSAVPSLTTNVLNQIPIIIPENNIMTKFNNVISSFYTKINFNTEQIQTLTKTRDVLLPKLMSGQIRVNEFKD